MKGILGRKAGMTQVFNEDGHRIPVTVIETKDNIVTQVKTTKTDGYDAIQLSYGFKKENKVIKAKRGHFAKAKTTPKRFTKEIRNMTGFTLGAKIEVDSLFKVGQLVDVTGTSKGKGFAGVIKRHNAKIGPMSHGSQFHRQIGSMSDVEGNKIQKGKNMPGQMGSVQKTTQNLVIVDINDKEGYMLIKGSVPGANKSFVSIKSGIKGLPSKQVVKLVDYKMAQKVNLEDKIETKSQKTLTKTKVKETVAILVKEDKVVTKTKEAQGE